KHRSLLLHTLVFWLGMFAGIASGNSAPSTPKPTSRPITIHNSAELNKLSNTLTDADVQILPGPYNFTPKLMAMQRAWFHGADPKRPPTLWINQKDADRWAFNLSDQTRDLHISDLRVMLPDCTGGLVSAAYDKTGADRVFVTDTWQSQGNVWWLHGGGRFYFKNNRNDSWAKKYTVACFDHPVQELIADETDAGWWTQNPERTEACYRDMQTVDCLYIGMHLRGVGFKFTAQDRAGGRHRHIKCVITGGPGSCLTVGWMAASGNIPANPLELSTWEDCQIDGLTQENKTCRRIEIVHTLLNGKMTDKVIQN